MSQSYANTNSSPIGSGMGNQRKEWVWPKGYSRFLRYPGSQDRVGYRVMRVGVISVLRVRGLFAGPVSE